MKKTIVKYLIASLFGLLMIFFLQNQKFALNEEEKVKWMEKIVAEEFQKAQEFKNEEDIKEQEKKIRAVCDDKSFGTELAEEIVTLQEMVESKKAKVIEQQYGKKAATQFLQLQRCFLRTYNVSDKVFAGEPMPGKTPKTQIVLLEYVNQAWDILKAEYDPKKIEELLPKMEKALEDYEKERNTDPRYSYNRQPYIIIYEQAVKFGTPEMIHKRKVIHTLWMFLEVGKKDAVDETHKLYNLVLQEVATHIPLKEIDLYDQLHSVYYSLNSTYIKHVKLGEEMTEEQKKFQTTYIDLYRVLLSEYDKGNVEQAIETMKQLKKETE